MSVQNRGGNNVAIITTAFTGMMDDPTALNLSGTNPIAAGGSLETFLGIAVASLDLSIINQATEGSALKRTFTVSAGEVLSFDWQLATRETVGQDYAFVTINGQTTTLGTVANALNPGEGDYTAQTGLNHFEHVFAAGGTVTIGFGLVDVGDYSVTSSLLVDNVSVVPEPSAALLGAIGALGLLRRRR